MTDDEPETRTEPPPPKRPTKAARYRELRAQGLSLAQIARAHGVTKSSVQSALKTSGPPLLAELLREDGTKIPCHYCGLDSEAVDVVRRGVSVSGDRADLRIPACRECRMIASRSRERVMLDRKAAVKKRLRAIYGERLNVPNWRVAELSGLSPEMRGFIQRALDMRDAVKDRLAW